ncbi:rhodanese-like domain-containing protein [Kitasatospora sp. NPDC001159]
MTREIDLDAFAAARAAGGFVPGVREPEEYRVGHVPGAVPVPLAEPPARLDVPADRPVCVICASGDRGLVAAGWMCARGIGAGSVVGGTRGRARAGRTHVVTGPRSH